MKSLLKEWLAVRLLGVLAQTWRIELEGELLNRPSVVAFWHGEMLPCWFVLRDHHPTALVSPSADGAILTQLLEKWHYNVLRGSSSHEQADTVEHLAGLAGKGLVAITPDGPRGPNHVAKPGAVVAAHRARVPLILMRMKCTQVWVFHKSWDRFIVPKPFANIRMVVEEQRSIAEDSTREQISAEIIRVTHRLDEL